MMAPYTVDAAANLLGGAASDALVRRLGPTWGRRTLGVVGLGSGCVCTIGLAFTRDPGITVLLLSLIYGAIALQQSGVFGVCLDIGGSHSGAVLWLRIDAARVVGSDPGHQGAAATVALPASN